MAQTQATPSRAAVRQPSAKFEIDVPADVVAVLEYGASRRGCSVAEFVVASAIEAADAEIGDIRPLRLSVDETVQLVEALDNPGEPNDAMLRAVQRRREYFGE